MRSGQDIGEGSRGKDSGGVERVTFAAWEIGGRTVTPCRLRLCTAVAAKWDLWCCKHWQTWKLSI